MSGLWEKMKEHPWLTGAIVLGVFILVYLLVGGGSAAPQATTQDNSYAAEVAAATQLQEAQLQGQTQMAGINAQVTAQQQQIQGAITVAQIQAQENQDNNNAQTTIASQQIAAQLQAVQGQQASQNLQTTTNGQIASNYIAAQQAVATAGFNTQEQLATTQANSAQTIYGDLFSAQTAQAQIAAGVTNLQTLNATAIATHTPQIFYTNTSAPGSPIQIDPTVSSIDEAGSILNLQNQYGIPATTTVFNSLAAAQNPAFHLSTIANDWSSLR